jgi:hypothetical protein
LSRKRNRKVRADDDAAANARAGCLRKRVGHERCRFADGDDAQHPAVETRTHVGVLDGPFDEMVRRCGFDCAARNG